MFKIIILPNKNICPEGKIIRFKNLKKNLYNILIKNSIFLKNYCGGVGKCNFCTVFFNENSFNLFNYRSCFFNLKGNFIIKIP